MRLDKTIICDRNSRKQAQCSNRLVPHGELRQAKICPTYRHKFKGAFMTFQPWALTKRTRKKAAPTFQMCGLPKNTLHECLLHNKRRLGTQNKKDTYHAMGASYTNTHIYTLRVVYLQKLFEKSSKMLFSLMLYLYQQESYEALFSSFFFFKKITYNACVICFFSFFLVVSVVGISLYHSKEFFETPVLLVL